MRVNRRRALALAGASVTGSLLAGCLSAGGIGSGDDEDESNGDDGSTDGTENGADLPRVDEPPYDVTEPECGDEADRDPLWLCENMPAEPSLEFEQVETTTSIFADEGLTLDDEADGSQFYATILEVEDDLERIEDLGGDVGELFEGTDFDAEAVLVVQTGWGSGSETPHLKRIEDTDDGIHAFGCHRRPCIWTDDYTMRTVLARFERPDDLEGGFVSLTVDTDRRVNLEVGEGVVTVTEDA